MNLCLHLASSRCLSPAWGRLVQKHPNTQHWTHEASAETMPKAVSNCIQCTSAPLTFLSNLKREILPLYIKTNDDKTSTAKEPKERTYITGTACVYGLSLKKINIFHLYRACVRQCNRSGISNLKKENYIHQISAIDLFFISLKVYISYIVILTSF